MSKLEIAEAEVVRIAIQQEIARSDESRHNLRLDGLLLIAGDQACRQVADLFDEDRRTVQRWGKRFESHGFEGMRQGERSGRPATLDARQWAALERDLRRAPRDLGRSGRWWDGKMPSKHLCKRYGIALGVCHCQRIFGQMGFRLRKPRPQVAQSDSVQAAAVGKTTSLCTATGH